MGPSLAWIVVTASSLFSLLYPSQGTACSPHHTRVIQLQCRSDEVPQWLNSPNGCYLTLVKTKIFSNARHELALANSMTPAPPQPHWCPHYFLRRQGHSYLRTLHWPSLHGILLLQILLSLPPLLPQLFWLRHVLLSEASPLPPTPIKHYNFWLLPLTMTSPPYFST